MYCFMCLCVCMCACTPLLYISYNYYKKSVATTLGLCNCSFVLFCCLVFSVCLKTNSPLGFECELEENGSSTASQRLSQNCHNVQFFGSLKRLFSTATISYFFNLFLFIDNCSTFFLRKVYFHFFSVQFANVRVIDNIKPANVCLSNTGTCLI